MRAERREETRCWPTGTCLRTETKPCRQAPYFSPTPGREVRVDGTNGRFPPQASHPPHRLREIFRASVSASVRYGAKTRLSNGLGRVHATKPKDAPRDDDDLNGFADFKGGKRSNATHASVTDPDARLTRKSAGDVSRLCYRADAVSENRNGLCAAVRASPAVGYTESQGAADNVRTMRRRGLKPRTMGADAGYYNEGFVDDMRTMGVTPHPALHRRRSDMGVKRTLAYKLSQKARKRVEQTFGWAKCVGGMRRVREIGIRAANAALNVVFAAGNLVRMARLEALDGGLA